MVGGSWRGGHSWGAELVIEGHDVWPRVGREVTALEAGTGNEWQGRWSGRDEMVGIGDKM